MIRIRRGTGFPNGCPYQISSGVVGGIPALVADVPRPEFYLYEDRNWIAHVRKNERLAIFDVVSRDDELLGQIADEHSFVLNDRFHKIRRSILNPNLAESDIARFEYENSRIDIIPGPIESLVFFGALGVYLLDHEEKRG